MVGKRVQFDDETGRRSTCFDKSAIAAFQQLAGEAFRDLLEKHRHPVDLKNQLRGSLGKPPVRTRPTRRAANSKPDA